MARCGARSGPTGRSAGVVYSACTVTAPVLVEVENARSRLVLGEPDGAISARTQALAEMLQAGGMTVEVSPRIRDAIWAKLLLNIASGPLAVLTGCSPRAAIAGKPACQAAVRTIIAEGAAIAAALGCNVVAGR